MLCTVFNSVKYDTVGLVLMSYLTRLRETPLNRIAVQKIAFCSHM